MSCVMRKPIFGVSDQAVQSQKRLEISDLESGGIVLSM